jgi:hypothetical protein
MPPNPGDPAIGICCICASIADILLIAPELGTCPVFLKCFTAFFAIFLADLIAFLPDLVVTTGWL